VVLYAHIRIPFQSGVSASTSLKSKKYLGAYPDGGVTSLAGDGMFILKLLPVWNTEPDTVKLPVNSALPVNGKPVALPIADASDADTFAISGNVSTPVDSKLPLIIWFPTKVLLPVVAYDAVTTNSPSTSASTASISFSLVVILPANDELKEVDEPVMSVAIWADEDSTPLSANNEPLKLPVNDEPVKLFAVIAAVVVWEPKCKILPVNVWLSSAELPNWLLPEAYWIDELTNTVSYWVAVSVPNTVTSPLNLPEPDTYKWSWSKSYLKAVMK